MLTSYVPPEGPVDEAFLPGGDIRPAYAEVAGRFRNYDPEDYRTLHEYARNYLRTQGVSFLVYKGSDGPPAEDTFPLDLFPRLLSASDWDQLERGIRQRLQAVNLFLADIYNQGRIFKDKIIPHDLVLSSSGYNREMEGFTPPGGIYTHVGGTDLILDGLGTWRILEDNVRNPSGVSYVLTNREIMKVLFGGLLNRSSVRPVSDYGDALYRTLASVTPHKNDPTIVLHTPGLFNSAYYEHGFLARQMGVQLVEGRDLFVDQEEVYMMTITGPEKVHVIYRRIDDDFLDPLVFRPDSVLGVPGLMQAYKAGNVTLANAPGAGAADDKAVYAYMPDIIRYYLGEDIIVPNVDTFFPGRPSHMQHIEENIDRMVIKPVNMSGGYGIFMGHEMTKSEQAAQLLKMKHNPRDYIAQPTVQLSTHPTYIESENAFRPRRVDLRIFSLSGDGVSHVLQGGLSRVALKEGCLVVNSSQGGGSKDTWVCNDIPNE